MIVLYWYFCIYFNLMYAYYFGLSGESSSYDALWCRCSMMSKPASMSAACSYVPWHPSHHEWKCNPEVCHPMHSHNMLFVLISLWPINYNSTHFSCHPKQLKSYLYLKYNNSENGRDGWVKGLLTSGLHTTLMVRRVYILTAEIAIKIFTTSGFFKVVFLRLWGTKKFHKWAGWII